VKTAGTKHRFLFAGGGTGGHIFPAIAVADEIKELDENSDILFVGTADKIESKVVPAAGYDFKSIWISGFVRGKILQNLSLIIKVPVAVFQSWQIIRKFDPAVVIGTGAYAAAPPAWTAAKMNKKVVLLEQNAYPGITNKLVGKFADKLYLTFEESQKYFKNIKNLSVTGNPVRAGLKPTSELNATETFGLEESEKILLILGGSGGAQFINDTIAENIERFLENGIQIIWQTGARYFENVKNLARKSAVILPFIDDIGAAYSAADLVLARAGSTTLAELAQLGIAAVLIPSPNVAGDHQKANAMALAEKDAAILVEEKNLKNELFELISQTINDEQRLNGLRENIKKFAGENSAQRIAREIVALADDARGENNAS